jgi:hypothetical protein
MQRGLTTRSYHQPFLFVPAVRIIQMYTSVEKYTSIEASMYSPKNLIVRADFVLGNRQGGDRITCKRWRRLFAEALPRLLGCADRCSRSMVRLHEGGGEACYTGWLRIPIERRPGRKRLRRFKARLCARLEASLLPVDGRVLKVGVRRQRTRVVEPIILPLPLSPEASEQGRTFALVGSPDGALNPPPLAAPT